MSGAGRSKSTDVRWTWAVGLRVLLAGPLCGSFDISHRKDVKILQSCDSVVQGLYGSL